ncbi:Probable polyamine transporter [Striga hermonthica]|uniref:Probable polyamine transporter n=1 Tax=Striga hermonthica TaxID=68872 RepID=A0A9N7N1Z4_STRHE|nr:Probable polyamine transporter [Striga hermonthica]
MGEEGMVANRKLTILPLIALIFYEVSGVEDSVRSGGGPFLSLLGFLVFPFFWSIPEALITAELATSFPANGGARHQLPGQRRLRPLDLVGLRPLLGLPGGLLETAARIPALPAITVVLTYLNYRGLHIVGYSAVLLACFSLFPFLVMGILAVPRLRPRRWLAMDYGRVSWRGYFNSLFWNLNYWDNASTLAGEVENPARAFPRALFGAVVLVVCSYLVPLLAGTGAVPLCRRTPAIGVTGILRRWEMLIGGQWLRWWIQAAAAFSNLGLFEAEMSSDAYQLLGMSEIGMLPAVFASRSKYNTPTFSILCSASGVILLSWMSFQEILEFLNFFYAIGVKCDKSTGHVIGLDLKNRVLDEYGYMSFDSMLQSETLDSFLLEMKHLKYLDLSWNNFNGSSIPAFLGSLKQLQYLNFSHAVFRGVIPHMHAGLRGCRAGER